MKNHQPFYQREMMDAQDFPQEGKGKRKRLNGCGNKHRMSFIYGLGWKIGTADN